MELIITKEYRELCERCADRVEQLLGATPEAVIGVIAGSTALGVYEALVRRANAGTIDFSRATLFLLDEYVGTRSRGAIPFEHDISFARFINEHLIHQLPQKPKAVHIPSSSMEESATRAAAYEALIRESGGIDVQLLGIGQNGHIGFNEPGSPFDSRTRVVTLAETTRRVNFAAYCARTGVPLSDMPTHAITLGIGTIAEARRIILLASGAGKAAIIARSLEGAVHPSVPATSLQALSPTLTVMLDEDASSLLTNRPHS